VPELKPGRACRTRDLAPWGKNPARLARRLVHQRKLREAAHGLYYAPVASKFRPALVADEVLLDAFLGGEPFLISGPPRWNALRLGSTSMFAAALVYNTQRTGEFLLDGRRFLLRRVYFPESPSPEWFVVDLLRHHDMAEASLSELLQNLVIALREGRFDASRLHAMAVEYGTKATLELVDGCVTKAQAPCP
jgi:hypothetical protein